MTNVNPDALAALLDRPAPPAVPPAPLLGEFMPELVALVDDCHAAATAATEAAAQFWATQPGGRLFNEALAADRSDVGRYLVKHGTLPDPAQSRLVGLLTRDVPVAFVAALHRRWSADVAFAQIPTWLSANGRRVAAALDSDMDARRDAIAEMLVTAREKKDQHAYLSAHKAIPEWAERNALLKWVMSGARAYDPRIHNKMPAELVALEFEAATVIQNPPPTVLPTINEELVAAFERDHPRFRNHTFTMTPARRRAIGA